MLLLSAASLKEKIDILFSWMDMDMDMPSTVSLEQFYISIVSFERGLSYAVGRPPCSEEYLAGVSRQWFSVCGSGRENESLKGTRLCKDKFNEFCTNRHYAVRVVLEAFAAAPFPEVILGEKLSHLVVTVADHESRVGAIKEPGGGDEWLANPTWIKTAEHMIPKSCIRNSDKPDVNFKLDWVHGYRGFDCRNNLRYVNAKGSAVVFNAAGLGVVQSKQSVEEDQWHQSFFGDHSDDVVCVAVAEPMQEEKWDGCIVATGEIGKVAAIHLWKPTGNMQSLICISGCHPKGVSHLVFSKDGSKLFSVGVEYSVAVHCVKEGEKLFGKLISSAQGPKGMALHACLFGPGGSDVQFLTCGEKHVVVWTLQGNSLKQETVSLKSYKNNVRCIYSRLKLTKLNLLQVFLCGARFGSSGSVALGTSDGLVLTLDGTSKELSRGSEKTKSHVKQNEQSTKTSKVSVSSCWSTPSGDTVLFGQSDGRVLILCVNDDGNTLSEKATLNIEYEGESGASRSASIRSVCLASDGAKALIGTHRCEVLEIPLPCQYPIVAFNINVGISNSGLSTSQSCSVINRGHFKDELW